MLQRGKLIYEIILEKKKHNSKTESMRDPIKAKENLNFFIFQIVNFA